MSKSREDIDVSTLQERIENQIDTAHRNIHEATLFSLGYAYGYGQAQDCEWGYERTLVTESADDGKQIIKTNDGDANAVVFDTKRSAMLYCIRTNGKLLDDLETAKRSAIKRATDA